MNVAIVTAHLSFDEHGGANYSIHRLATELCERGHAVTVYTTNHLDENDYPNGVDYRVRELNIGARTLAGSATGLTRKLRAIAEQNDVLHAYTPGVAVLVGGFAAVSDADVRTVATLNSYTPICSNSSMLADGCWRDCSLVDRVRHARDPNAESIARYAFEQISATRLLSNLDAIMCLSPSVQQIYREAGVDPRTMRVIPNMADPTFETRTFETATDGGRGDRTRLLYVGRTDPSKGIDTLLQALGELGNRRDWHLDVVGDDILDYAPEGLDTYRARAREAGIGDRVTYHGWVEYDSLSDHYAAADVFVHPGRWPEPFGRTLLEALQHDLPVICSDVGAPPWVVGNAGLRFARESYPALAARIQTLLEEPALREELAGQTAAELKRFEPERVMPEIIETYQGEAL